MAIVAQTDTCTPALAMYGSHELKKSFLEPAILGQAIGAIAITEPQAGSDISALSTTAVQDGANYRISGRKCYITNGSLADFVVTLCRTEGQGGIAGMSLIVVPTNLPGFRVIKRYEKLGNSCCDHAELAYNDVLVPSEYLLGMPGMGYEMQMVQLQHERLLLATIAAAQARRLLRRAVAYSGQRTTFGQRLGDHQSIAFGLVDLELELTLLEQMLSHCSRQLAAGQECAKEVAMVKLKASRQLRQVADQTLQILGGYGYMEDPEIIRGVRDSRAVSLAGGTDQMMQRVLASYLHGR